MKFPKIENSLNVEIKRLESMNGFLIFALIPLVLTIGITPALPFDLIPEADALKAARVSQPQYGSATAKIVCGDRLCSEVSGGYEAWKEGQGESSRVEAPSVSAPEMKAKEMDSMEKGIVLPSLSSSRNPASLKPLRAG